MLLGPRCLLEESNVSTMPPVIVPKGQSRFMNASSFPSALPAIDLRLSHVSGRSDGRGQDEQG